MFPGRLEKKRALITGASHGIGRGIARAFAAEGATLVVTYNSDQASAESLVREVLSLGGRIHAEPVDFTRLDRVESLTDTSLRFLGGIDVLVNNVGVTTRTAFTETTPEQFDYVLDVNLKFPFFLTQLVVRSMVAQDVRGSVINVSSISAYKAISRMAHYQCSKAAVSMFTRSLAYELAAHRIRVNTLSPGLTATKGNRDQWEGNPALWRDRGKDIPLGRAGTPADCCGAAVFLASDESSWVTGADLVIDGGESAI
jgi:NAD(P)-dependent dehydrogenase (short-subunit alcohol dehydrogenase family)